MLGADISLTVLALAGLTAGFVDAVVGGGGLVQLPALLLGLPGASPVEVLATNKASAVWGTATSSATYVRRVRPDRATFVPLMLAAFLGAALGAVVATQISKEAFTPVVLVALLLVGAYVLLRPSMGAATELRFTGRHHTLAAVGTGLVVGFYDGVLGPGTGSFFVIALVGLIGFDFLQASAQAKIANVATNLAALAVFVPMGAVQWPVAVVMGAANLVGGWVGARTAISRGSGFVRGFFLVVVGAFVVRLGGEVLGLWG